MTVSFSDVGAIVFLDKQISILKQHIFVKRVQVQSYNDMKDNLRSNDILVHVDYSESYENKQQREIQSAYFGHSSFSIFTACCYLKSISDVTCKESITITSESSDHSRSAALTCVMKVIEFVREKHQHLPLKVNAHIWSDGCAAQFRSRFLFQLLTTIDNTINLT